MGNTLFSAKLRINLPKFKSCLSAWELLLMDERTDEKNESIALRGGAKAVLQCGCGAIGVVMPEDVGNGELSCPGCDNSYCIKCGNEVGTARVTYRTVPNRSKKRPLLTANDRCELGTLYELITTGSQT